jgi:hypothetical protein
VSSASGRTDASCYTWPVFIPARPDSLAYRAHALLNSLRLRRNRAEAERLFERTISAIDQRAFTDTFRRYWTPFPTSEPAKYLIERLPDYEGRLFQEYAFLRVR